MDVHSIDEQIEVVIELEHFPRDELERIGGEPNHATFQQDLELSRSSNSREPIEPPSNVP